MDAIKEGVLYALRGGCSTEAIRDELLKIINELKSMEVYMQAVKDSGFRP